MRFFSYSILLLLFLFLPERNKAQASRIDSIEKAVTVMADDTAKVSVLLGLARELYTNASYEKALLYADEAAELARKTHFQKAEALAFNIKGAIFRAQGKYDESLQQHFRALKIREGIGDSLGVSNSYNNIGLLYWGKENYDLALDYHQKALRIREALGDQNSVASSYVNIGMTLYKQGINAVKKEDIALAELNFNKALDHYEKARQYFEKQGAAQSEAACLNNMANVYADQAMLATGAKKAVEATRYYDLSLQKYFKAKEVLSAAGDRQSVVITLNNISYIYREQKDFQKAQVYAEQSLKEAKEIGAQNEMQEAYLNLAEIASAMKLFEQAYEYHRLYSATKDSLLNAESNKQIVEMQTKYETEKKDKELIAKSAEARQASQQRNFFVAGFIAMILLAFLILRGYRQKQKANVEITRQKHLVEEKQKEILDSIHYAKRIQNSLLPNERYIEKKIAALKKQE